MPEVQTNLRILKPSRKKPKPGELFAMQLIDDNYLFGRVITAEARWTKVKDVGPAVLIYIYKVRSDRKQVPSRDALRPDQLLVSPIMTNRLPWSHGYFETIHNRPLESVDVLPRHCFSDASATGKYFDEMSNELPGAIEPVGDYGLHSFRTIDDQISDALGIPRAPEDA